MDDIRELQRQKWLKAKETQPFADSSGSASTSAGSASTNQSSAASAAASPAVQSEPPAVKAEPPAAPANTTPTAASDSGELANVRRLHILPVGADVDSTGQPRLQLLSPELRRLRSAKETVKTGMYVHSSGHEFVIVKSDPDQGFLDADTDYFVDGEYIARFVKVQFICLWDYTSSNNSQDPATLFSDYISPYFKSLTENGEGKMGNVVAIGDTIKIFDLEFQVMVAEPSRPEIGIIDSSTMVYVDWDTTPEFEKIHIVPFQDTLPGAYEYDVFTDYLKPYLTTNKHIRLQTNDQFTYQGVQFKVVCCEPNGPARIGRNTTIYCEGMLHPSLRNLLPPELLEQLSHLPPGLQMLLLNTEALAGGYEERLIEVQEMLSRRRGLSNETIGQVPKFRWEGTSASEQTQCMICLSDFVHGEEVRQLPCGHVFHAGCIDEWLRRCTDCPICKNNVDRAVRQY